MTIPEGCKKQGKNLEDIVSALKEQGFEVI